MTLTGDSAEFYVETCSRLVCLISTPYKHGHVLTAQSDACMRRRTKAGCTAECPLQVTRWREKLRILSETELSTCSANFRDQVQHLHEIPNVLRELKARMLWEILVSGGIENRGTGFQAGREGSRDVCQGAPISLGWQAPQGSRESESERERERAREKKK